MARGTVPDKLPPNNVEAEEAVLGSLLYDPDRIVEIAHFLDPDDFYIERNKWLYQVLLDLLERNTPIDLLTVTDELEHRKQLNEIGGSVRLSELINRTPTSSHVGYYAQQVKKCAWLRGLIDAAGQIARLAYDDNADPVEVQGKAEQLLFDITPKSFNGFRSIGDITEDEVNRQEKIHQNGGVLGIQTGLTDLDRLTGGLQNSDMVVIAGRPGSGKTSLGLSIALHAATGQNKRVGMFSVEMSDEQLGQRIISSEARINSQALRLGQLRDEEWAPFLETVNNLQNVPLFIDDTPALSVQEMRSKAKRIKAEQDIDLLIIDYLQLMEAGIRANNTNDLVTHISRNIKRIARELNIPVIALSQLSRAVEGRQDKRPVLSDLRSSGSIEQDSDIVIFIYRDEMYNPDTEFPNIAEIILAKHRHGPTGVTSVYFRKSQAQFLDLEVHKQPLDL